MKEVAKRDEVSYRFDILDPNFLCIMAEIGAVGAKKYGDFTWQKSRLEGDKSPINHIYKHLTEYQKNTPYEHPEITTNRVGHLGAIAFNAMMEFWHEVRSGIDE